MTTAKGSAPRLGARRRFDEALEYVGRAWFPFNSELLRHIQGKLTTGAYKGKGLLLLDDLKKDFALYTYCIRRLGDVATEEEKKINPTHLIRRLEIERLKAMLEVPEEKISTHRLDSSIKPQILRLKHTAISASTAQVMAQETFADADQAFLCAVIRQLGMNLIAWNYPRIYQKALTSLNEFDGDLDQALLRVLGYSPLQIGACVAADWCQSEEVRVVLGLDVAEQSAQGEASAASSLVLKEFCEIGEALARANDPEHYPTALKEYEGAVAQISQHIGPRGLSLIQASIAKNIRAYEGIPGNLLRAELISEEALRTSFSDYGERLFEQNLFAKRCPEPVQEVLKKAYAQITGGQVSTTAINIFATEVIPALGFHCGCVYLVDKNKNAVVPMLRLGDTDLNRFRPINISDSAGNPHPISEALTFTTPIIQENVFVNSDQVTHITGTFGNDTKTGVLYLEMSPSLSKRDRAEPLQLFKAAKQCLNDCLNLR